MTNNPMIWQDDRDDDRAIAELHHVDAEGYSLQSIDMDSAFVSMELQYESAQIMNHKTDKLITA